MVAVQAVATTPVAAEIWMFYPQPAVQYQREPLEGSDIGRAMIPPFPNRK